MPERRAAAHSSERARAAPRAAVAIGLLVLALFLSGCADTRPYVAALDALPFPATWQVVRTDVGTNISFCANCPHITRYYLATGETTDVLKQINEALREAGYNDVQSFNPACDLNTNDARCSVTARNDRFLIIAGVFDPGHDVDQLGLSRPDAPMVRITAQAS